MRNPMTAVSAWWRHPRKRLLLIGGSVFFVLIVFHLWLHITNPYAGTNIVQQPYTTSVDNGTIHLHKQFTLKAYSSPPAQLLGYYKQGFLIAQNTVFGGRPLPVNDLPGIERMLHRQRFDPRKPYLISGDQFSVLYPRNLGIFYSSLLDPYTADSQKDWENRQRLYLQSVMYALDAFSSEKVLTTTVVPVSPKSVVLTEVHPGSIPSDTMYGLLYALDSLQDQSRFPDAPYKLEAVDAVHDVLKQRHDDLRSLLYIYLYQVRDPQTGLVRRDLNFSGARDGVVRDSSFYDNVILWKTIQLANKLGIDAASQSDLDGLRDKIIATYWDDHEGHFKDDQSSKPANQNYSSDWLVAVTTGFLDASNSTDREYMVRSHTFIQAQGIANPFPIKYQAQATTEHIPWAVRTFLPSYGANVVWSYWGCQYITMLNDLYAATQDKLYDDEATKALNTYASKIISNHGFPETFTPDGSMLRGGIYKSILRNGWIVDFESAKAQQARDHL